MRTVSHVWSTFIAGVRIIITPATFDGIIATMQRATAMQRSRTAWLASHPVVLS